MAEHIAVAATGVWWLRYVAATASGGNQWRSAAIDAAMDAAMDVDKERVQGERSAALSYAQLALCLLAGLPGLLVSYTASL